MSGCSAVTQAAETRTDRQRDREEGLRTDRHEVNLPSVWRLLQELKGNFSPPLVLLRLSERCVSLCDDTENVCVCGLCQNRCAEQSGEEEEEGGEQIQHVSSCLGEDAANLQQEI